MRLTNSSHSLGKRDFGLGQFQTRDSAKATIYQHPRPQRRQQQPPPFLRILHVVRLNSSYGRVQSRAFAENLLVASHAIGVPAHEMILLLAIALWKITETTTIARVGDCS